MTIKYTPDLIQRLVDVFPALEAEQYRLQQRKAQILSEVLGIPVQLCEICHRPMLPRRLWEVIPLERRSKVATRVGVVTNGTLCFNHYTQQQRALSPNSHRLTPEKIIELQERNTEWYREARGKL